MIKDNPTQHELDRAAARVVLDASALVNQAHEASGLEQQDLADAIGVSAGRVSQVLNGDGNFRLSTLAKFLRAAGYRLRLSAEPIRDGLPHLPKSRRQRRTGAAERTPYVSVEPMHFSDGDSVGVAYVFHVSHTDPRQHLGRAGEPWDLETGDRVYRLPPRQVSARRVGDVKVKAGRRG